MNSVMYALISAKYIYQNSNIFKTKYSPQNSLGTIFCYGVPEYAISQLVPASRNISSSIF